MAVRPDAIENQERGLDLRNREGGPKLDASPGVRAPEVQASPAAAELREFRARLAAAEATPPQDTAPHCRDCYLRGHRATLRAIRGE